MLLFLMSVGFLTLIKVFACAHIFCHVILGFLKSFVQVSEFGKSFWGEGEVILIYAGLLLFPKGR